MNDLDDEIGYFVEGMMRSTMRAQPSRTTIQQFIKDARKLPSIVLEHAIIFHETMENGGFIHRGKNNETMRKLRRLGFYTFDKNTPMPPNYNPCWHITDAGRALVPSAHQSLT